MSVVLQYVEQYTWEGQIAKENESCISEVAPFAVPQIEPLDQGESGGVLVDGMVRVVMTAVPPRWVSILWSWLRHSCLAIRYVVRLLIRLIRLKYLGSRSIMHYLMKCPSDEWWCSGQRGRRESKRSAIRIS